LCESFEVLAREKFLFMKFYQVHPTCKKNALKCLYETSLYPLYR
jgi:hypothetical protein